MRALIKELIGKEQVVYKDGPERYPFHDRLNRLATTPNVHRDEEMDLGPARNIQLYKKVLFDITTVIKPKLVVELGVREGYSTDAFIRALYSSNGRLVSFDPQDKVQRSNLISGYETVWTYHGLTGEEGFERYSSELGEIDMLYIDTDPHSYEQMRMWLSRYWIRNLRPGGYVVFDDCAPQHQNEVNDSEIPHGVWNVGARYGVLRAVLEYIQGNPDRIDFAVSYGNVLSNGIGVMKISQSC